MENTEVRTNAEAQAILVFIDRALARADRRGGSIAYSVQIELDILCKETGVKQGFQRILPTRQDEGMPCCEEYDG